MNEVTSAIIYLSFIIYLLFDNQELLLLVIVSSNLIT